MLWPITRYLKINGQIFIQFAADLRHPQAPPKMGHFDFWIYKMFPPNFPPLAQSMTFLYPVLLWIELKSSVYYSVYYYLYNIFILMCIMPAFILLILDLGSNPHFNCKLLSKENMKRCLFFTLFNIYTVHCKHVIKTSVPIFTVHMLMVMCINANSYKVKITVPFTQVVILWKTMVIDQKRQSYLLEKDHSNWTQTTSIIQCTE